MRKALIACGTVIVAGALAACGPEPAQVDGHTSFGACTGRPGQCGGEDCCASNSEFIITGENINRVDCKIFAGSRETEMRVDFEIISADSQQRVAADNLTFDNNVGQMVGVRLCDGFEITVDGNRFTSSECGNLEPRAEPPRGGGCVVELHLDANEELIGRFRCLELQVPGQELYFSTLYDGDFGWGEFGFQNCIDRR